MTLRNFLKLHKYGCAGGRISIHQLPYNHGNHGYEATYFEEGNQDAIINSDVFKKIANRPVDHFNIIGGGIYRVELCIYLKEKP